MTDLGVLAAVLFSFANESADLVLSRPAALYSAEGRIDPGQITVKRLDGTSPCTRMWADSGRARLFVALGCS